ncbi:MAG: thioredoxin domain-containing protein [Candidatus Peribacteraceae bacterium]|nr:thioredoxin domain-containing protein [Candidatus Peribacteraceae bacterium]
MKRLLSLAILTLTLTACVDTTGLVSTSSKPPKGNPQSVVVVTEYADLECPACRTANTAIVQPLLQKYATQIRYEFKHFPLRSLHRFTMDLAEASECAADQGKFWEYVDAAFENQSELKSGSATTWGEALVGDTSLFSRCVRSHIKKDAVMADYDEGVARGVLGTPTFYVNGTQTPATLDALSAAIEEQVKGARERL